MKAIVLSATKGVGRSIARQLVERGDDVFVLGIEPEELQKTAADLEQRGGGKKKVGFALCDMENTAGFEAALDAADAALGNFDAVIVTAALFATQDRLESDIAFTQRLLTVNYANTVVFCERARVRLLARGGGTLCVFSSVAGDRGRKPVILYGSSKAGLSAYLEGLDHKFHAQGLRVICVKPGFMKTSMTEGLPVPPFAGEPEQVARQVISAMTKSSPPPVIYAPRIWQLVMLVIRWLPRFVMRKIKF